MGAHIGERKHKSTRDSGLRGVVGEGDAVADSVHTNICNDGVSFGVDYLEVISWATSLSDSKEIEASCR